MTARCPMILDRAGGAMELEAKLSDFELREAIRAYVKTKSYAASLHVTKIELKTTQDVRPAQLQPLITAVVTLSDAPPYDPNDR